MADVRNDLTVFQEFRETLGTRNPTRREHLGELQRCFGFRSFSLRLYRQLSHWLITIAMGTDEGVVLVEALLEELRP